jgi:hypothetical protein
MPTCLYQHLQALVLLTGLQTLDLGGPHTYTTQVTPVTAKLATLAIVATSQQQLVMDQHTKPATFLLFFNVHQLI